MDKKELVSLVTSMVASSGPLEGLGLVTDSSEDEDEGYVEEVLEGLRVDADGCLVGDMLESTEGDDRRFSVKVADYPYVSSWILRKVVNKFWEERK